MAATHEKTTRFACVTSTANLATNTTLGTATRLDFTTLTIESPENTSRTFLSVVARFSYRDVFAAANEVTGMRLGIKLGAAAATDLDVSFTQANAGDHLYDEAILDCTAYFNANFGSGTSQTCVPAIAVSMTTGANIGGNITCEFEITYAYDDTAGTTRIKSVPIVIGSHSTTLTASQQEVGVDGTAPPAANQIPILDSFLCENTVSIKQAYIVVECNDTSISTVDCNAEIQIDAGATSARGTVEQNLQTSARYRDIFIYDTATYATSAAHAFKMRDTALVRFANAGGIMWVTYTYDKSATTRMLNVACVPMHQSVDAIHSGQGTPTTNIVGDSLYFYAPLDIQEPGTITMLQSGVKIRLAVVQSGSAFVLAASTQTPRTYTPPAVQCDTTIHHRCDGANGWALERGSNRKFVKYYTGGASRSAILGMEAVIVYSSDVPAGGTEVGNRPLTFFTKAYSATPALGIDIADSGGGQQIPSIIGAWKLSGIGFEGNARVPTAFLSPHLMVHERAGELDSSGWVSSMNIVRGGLPETGSNWIGAAYTNAFNKDSNTTGRMDPQVGHRILTAASQTHLVNLVQRLQIHNITHTVAGRVTAGGSPVADGKTVNVHSRSDFHNTPHWKATGAANQNTTSILMAWPTTHQASDIGLLFVHTENGQAATLSDAQGFVEIGHVESSAIRLTVFWCRATSSAMTGPTVADSGDHQMGVIVTFGGCTTTGDPWDVYTSDSATTNTVVTIPGPTTTIDHALVVAAVASDINATTSGWANANLLSADNEVVDINTLVGNDGSIAATIGVKVAAGAVGNTTATLSTTSTQARFSIALKGDVVSRSDLVTTATIAGGDGEFTVEVPSDTMDHFASYEDGTDVGRSLSGTPGVDTFDIQTGSSGGGGYGTRAMVVNR